MKLLQKLTLWLTLGVASLMLGGCTTTLHNNVAAFHEWPTELGNGNNTFAFAAAPDGIDNNGIEYQQYQQQIAQQLVRLGLVDVSKSEQRAALSVSLNYSTKPIDVITLIDPFFGSNSAAYPYPLRVPYWYNSPYWSRFGLRNSIYPYHNLRYARGLYDPFWYSAQLPEENTAQRFQRKLEIGITRIADGKKLYEVTVENASRRQAQNQVLPYLIQSAFVNFPGKSGESHRVDIKLDSKAE